MTFSPPRVAISSITQANPCVVTTSSNHNLSTGAIVRLHVPNNFGMTPLNNFTFSATVLSPTTFSLQTTQVPPAMNINSINFPAFVVPSNPGATAEVLCIGSGPSQLTNTPWQITNNTCSTELNEQVLNISTTEIPF